MPRLSALAGHIFLSSALTLRKGTDIYENNKR